MRATYEALVDILTGLLTTMMGVKTTVAEHIDLRAFWETILYACNLGRDDASMKGHMLSEYKLDSRLRDLVPPRGVYISSDRFAVDLIPHDKLIRKIKEKDKDGNEVEREVDSFKVLSPTDFHEVQAQLIGAMRKSVELNVALEEAIKEVELASVASRTVIDGMCHYCETPYLPIPCNVALYSKGVWYNMPSKDMLRELSVAVLKQFR
jgi:hypothetical protein